jgi:glycosyltransferase involved in cell wall biosynthesis
VSAEEVAPHVSVILPYHNREDTLEEAARSVLDQTYQSLTLYLIDDGSTDDSQSVAKSLDDPRIFHIALTGNHGVAHARNAGLSEAATSLVAFMDSDDVWRREKLETQIHYLRKMQSISPDVSVAGCGWRFYESEMATKVFQPGPFSRIDVLHNRVAGMGTPTLLVDRDVAVSDARFDESLPSLEEGDYVMSCLANGSEIVVLPEVLVLVRRGRDDHLATPRLTARAWEAFIDKYPSEFGAYPKLLAWYSYRAARDHLKSRNIRGALHHVPAALSEERGKRLLHLLFGMIGGRVGLAVAQRLVRLN